MYKFDCVPTLYATRALWVLGDVEGKVDFPGRLLSLAEKARCCGINVEPLQTLSPSQQAFAIWRCLPPAMLAQVLVGVLKSWVENEDCQFFSQAAASAPSQAAASAPPAPQTRARDAEAWAEAKRRRVSESGARGSGPIER